MTVYACRAAIGAGVAAWAGWFVCCACPTPPPTAAEFHAELRPRQYFRVPHQQNPAVHRGRPLPTRQSPRRECALHCHVPVGARHVQVLPRQFAGVPPDVPACGRIPVAPPRPPHRDAMEVGKVSPPPPPPRRPATVSLTPSASFNGVCNRQSPPPTALATSSNRPSNCFWGRL